MIVSKNILLAKDFLEQDEIVAIPTETVYGLAASIYSEKAINKIYATKARPSTNPLIIHVANESDVTKYVTSFPDSAKELAAAFWPGSLTLILPKKHNVPDYVTSNQPNVAIRIPNHELTRSLIEAVDVPLAAPSANPSNRVSATQVKHVIQYFENTIPMVLDGGTCSQGLESTIIGFDGDQLIVYRLGAIPLEAIQTVTSKPVLLNHKKENSILPGSFLKHYAPKTKLIISENPLETIQKCHWNRVAFLGFNQPFEHKKVAQNYLLSEKGDLSEAASKLYETLLKIDENDFDGIVTTFFPDKGLGNAINDRLKRASAN